jgi:hypothetical protein
VYLRIIRAFDGFNGTNITCTDGIARPEEAEVQDTIAAVLGEL